MTTFGPSEIALLAFMTAFALVVAHVAWRRKPGFWQRAASLPLDDESSEEMRDE